MGTVTLEGTPARWTLVIRGKLDEATGLAVHEQLREHARQGAAPSEVLFDLRGVEDYDVLGRAELAAAHRTLVAKHRRCAYVSTTTRIRGLAILAIGEVQDRNAQAVATIEQGEVWLTEGRLVDAQFSGVEHGADLRRR